MQEKSVVKRLAARMLAEQGHLVMAFRRGPLPMPRVGETITHSLDGGIVGGTVDGPFLVASTATKEEWIDQAEKYAGARTLAKSRSQAAIGFFRLVRARGEA